MRVFSSGPERGVAAARTPDDPDRQDQKNDRRGAEKQDIHSLSSTVDLKGLPWQVACRRERCPEETGLVLRRAATCPRRALRERPATLWDVSARTAAAVAGERPVAVRA